MTQFTEDSLWLSFKLDNANYCVLSDYVESIQVPRKIEPIPNSAATLAGITSIADALVGVIELRTVFGKMNLETYTAQFGIMKDMHIAWVEDLARFAREGGTFDKPVNPHKCKFGLWYDGFQTDNYGLNHILKKLSGPHERIHQCGAEIKELIAKGGDNRAPVESTLAEATRICYQEVVPMLEQLIEIYRDVNKGILIVVNDGVNRAALLVDEVAALVACHKTRQQAFPARVNASPLLRELVIDGESVMLEINVERILGSEQAQAAAFAAASVVVESVVDVAAKAAAKAAVDEAIEAAIEAAVDTEPLAAVDTEQKPFDVMIDTRGAVAELYTMCQPLQNHGHGCACGHSHK